MKKNLTLKFNMIFESLRGFKDTLWDVQACKVIYVVLAIVFNSSLAFASLTEAQGVRIVLGEARGEPFLGQVAVAEVARRRNSTKPFFGYTAKFKHTPEEYQTALRAWHLSASTNYSNNATHFEGDSFKRPRWIHSMNQTAHIGRQTFYREKRRSHEKQLSGNGSKSKRNRRVVGVRA